jgi:hypothetical protein
MARSRELSKIFSSDTPIILEEELNTTLESYIDKEQAQAPFRNLIINGAMQVAQRGTSTTGITGGGYYTADRHQTDLSSQGTWTQSVENDAPTGSGFRKSLKMLCTTADASPAATDTLRIRHAIEGQNLQSVRKGTSDAQQLTVSFWVKSNLAGTYITSFQDLDNSRYVSKSYTINSSGTWEKKTIVFPADTTGAFDNDNNASLSLQFWLGAGSNFTSGTLQNTWGADVIANRAVGQTNLAAATNNYWQVTGVQLEVGAIATPFEFKPFEQDLRECQRYYYVTKNFEILGNNNSSSQAVFDCKLPVTMRVAPSLTLPASSSTDDPIHGIKTSATAPVGFQQTTNTISFGVYGGFSSLTVGSKNWWAGTVVQISAEL